MKLNTDPAHLESIRPELEKKAMLVIISLYQNLPQSLPGRGEKDLRVIGAKDAHTLIGSIFILVAAELSEKERDDEPMSIDKLFKLIGENYNFIKEKSIELMGGICKKIFEEQEKQGKGETKAEKENPLKEAT